MIRVENPIQFRNNICQEFKKIFTNDKLCNNLEKGIFNFSIAEAERRNVVKKWDNIYFTQLYVDKLRSVIINLQHQKKLRQDVINKRIKPHIIAFMTHQEMAPQKWENLVNLKQIKDENRYTPKLDANTDDFTCYKCKSNRCSYYQLQTRCADEPMTTFVTCIDCGNRWKC